MAIKLYTKSWRIGTTELSGLEISNTARVDIVNWQAYDQWTFDFRGGVILRYYITEMPETPETLVDSSSSVELTQFNGISGESIGPSLTVFTENSAASTTTVTYSGYNTQLDVYTDIDEDETPGFEPDRIIGGVDSPTSVFAIELFYPSRGDFDIVVSARNRITHITENVHFPVFFRVAPFENYDPNIFRIWLSTPVELPWACPNLAPNEWVTSDTINDVILKFADNLQYLKYASDAYFWPGFYRGWFGTSAVDVAPAWRANIQNLSADLVNFNGVNYFDIVNLKDIKVYQNHYWLAADRWISCRDRDYYGTVTNWITAKPDLDTFGSIGAIDFDYSNGNLFVLDVRYNEVVVYNVDTDNVITYMYRWGGSDTLLPKAKFLGTNDIHIDIDGNVFIVDTSNSCVKKFSPIGAWIFTIRHPEIIGTTISTTGPISVTTDQEKNIHVLTFKWVYVFGPIGTFLRKYSCNTGEQPKKITTNYSKNGFVYITYTHPTWGGRVIKFTTTGVVAGSVAEFLRNYRPNAFNSVTHDENRNLYIAANKCIIAYEDEVRITSVNKQYWPDWFHYDPRYLEWPLSAMQIDREEFVQDWVYNRSFARLWDNMEIFRRSIYGKFVEQPFSILPGISSVFVNFMELNDERYFPYKKDDLVIGMNEFVTFDVVNRVCNKLCANQEVLREMLLERPLPPIQLQGEELEREELGDTTLPPSPILNAISTGGTGSPDSTGGGSITPASGDDAIIFSNATDATGVPPKLGGNGLIVIPGEKSFENVRKSIFFPTFSTPPVDPFCWSWNSCRDKGVNGIFWTETDSVTGARPVTWNDATSTCCTTNNGGVSI